LNGKIPSSDFFKVALPSGLPIYAIDGAANSLNKIGVAPTLILGDLDSVIDEVAKQYPTLCLPDQNFSDLQKSLLYLEQNDMLPTIMVGIDGGCIDHILNNINIFVECGSIFVTEYMVCYAVRDNITLRNPLRTKISLFGIPSARVSSHGLKWELHNADLAFPGQTSCFNRTNSETLTLNVHSGTVLACVYLNFIDDAGNY
jgi:thiamine pyrophosphokinase